MHQPFPMLDGGGGKVFSSLRPSAAYTEISFMATYTAGAITAIVLLCSDGSVLRIVAYPRIPTTCDIFVTTTAHTEVF